MAKAAAAARHGWAQGWRQLLPRRALGAAGVLAGLMTAVALASYDAADPSFNASSALPPANLLGRFGANLADVGMQSLGLAAWALPFVLILGGVRRLTGQPSRSLNPWVAVPALLALAGFLAAPAPPATWPLAKGLGGFWGETALTALARAIDFVGLPQAKWIGAGVFGLIAAATGVFALGLKWRDVTEALAWMGGNRREAPARRAAAPAVAVRKPKRPAERALQLPDDEPEPPFAVDEDDDPRAPEPAPRVATIKAPRSSSKREERENQGSFAFVSTPGFRMPELNMLTKAKPRAAMADEAALLTNARLLEGVLAEFGVSGRIDQIRPGPVVTLYELVPAPGVKTARVVALADDIARSMSVVSCRVSVASGRNAIGIELPNHRRETVYLRDLLSSSDYERSTHVLPLALGETIGGESYITDLARMPHLLIAGTTGSGKSVGVNAMILSILYRLSPEQCRLIMIDPKMLELSVYDGIPHLLAPVVTDPKKAIVALKWTVREMEDRYRRMSKIGVRNIAGYNERARELAAKGEHFVRTVQTGFDEQGRAIYEEERLDPEHMPYLVVVIDEVADLMMVAGKDIEGAVQRLAQMARAAGIHLIMATQRPSVDVITGTIKANFPTRISFQVTSKIDARTILGEQGAEQLLGQGDMLYMAGGGRITRLHGPFVADSEVEAVAAFLRKQGEPQYLDEVTASPEGEDGDGDGGFGDGEGGSGDDLYDRAVAVVTRDRKASTSYIQRRLQIGYNRAASLIERMEHEGVVSPANHAGKRDILAGPPPV
jgi:S-DNA-T family DNA segregation ATPase FtsK/SpoIIIE